MKTIWKIAIIFLVLQVCALGLFAQASGTTSTTTPTSGSSSGTTNSPFAIATVPALALVSSPQQVLRPSTVQQLEAAVGQFFDPSSGALTLPDSFAAEFSPALVLFGNSVTLADYQRLPWLYRTAISVATAKSSTTTDHSAAIGIRTMIIDGSDLRLNRDFLDKVTALQGQISDIIAASTTPTSGTNISAENQAKIDDLKKQIAALPATYWASDSLQVAAAVGLSESSLSPVNGAFQSLAAWLDYQAELFHNKAAVVFELTHMYVVSPAENLTSAAASFSFGSNEIRMILEARGGYDWQTSHPNFDATASIETKVPSTSFWVEVNGGLSWDTTTRQLVGSSGFAVRTNLSQ